MVKYFIVLLCSMNLLTSRAQKIYVDSNTGNDNNNGSKESPVLTIKKAAEIIKSPDNDIYIMKINPGMYVLDHYISISTDKNMSGKRIVIESTILPGDSLWTPEKMPIIICTAKKGEIPSDYHFVTSFLIEASHVTFRGIKFPGYFYPNTRYFPIARLDKSKTDLFVEQCLFVGHEDASHLQVGIIAHGDSVRADHCIFYNVRNSIVFWQDTGNGSKTGNGITNSIIYGATQSGVWTAWPDKDFTFKNNIVANCKNAWIKNGSNPTVYTIDNCIFANNKNYLVNATSSGFDTGGFKIVENGVVKEGTVNLVPKDAVTHLPLPINYLHVEKESLGYDLGAGLFKN